MIDYITATGIWLVFGFMIAGIFYLAERINEEFRKSRERKECNEIVRLWRIENGIEYKNGVKWVNGIKQI